MAHTVSHPRFRRSFASIPETTPLPNLIELQLNSYESFFNSSQEDEGLIGIFRSIFPVSDSSGRAQLEFCSYQMEEPKYTIQEAHQKGMTYASSLRARFRFILWDIDEETGTRSIRHVKEQEVYMGDIPLMTPSGTFVVNGSERVVISQMHRSPGVFFDHDRGRTHASGKYLFASRVIPYRGSWLDFEFDAKDLLFIRIDRKRKLPATTLLMALNKDGPQSPEPAPSKKAGMTREEILHAFYQLVSYQRVGEKWKTDFLSDSWKNIKLSRDLLDADTGEVVAQEGEKLTARVLKTLDDKGLKNIFVDLEDIFSRYVATDIVSETTGEVLAQAGNEITSGLVDIFEKNNVNTFKVLHIDHVNVGPYLRNTLAADKNTTQEEALLDIYRVLRPSEPPTVESAKSLFYGLFFDQERYDLSPVGRVKINARLNIQANDSMRILQKEDIFAIVRTLLNLKDGRGNIDDIDSLSNRRIRSVGELIENQYRSGLVRMERTIRERMMSVELDEAMPHDFINAKPIASVLREFFCTSQLSQFMDQTNPLSEVNHKRRLSALGPGGIKKDHAVFEVRDVHPTHYGRICPVETPEGQNIGLINSLATYARINHYGFIETPYRRVVKGVVTPEVVYLSAIEEERYVVAQANATVNPKGELVDVLNSCRQEGEYIVASAQEVDFIDVSPKQLLSVASSLIPFIENDDANRALMGSNMQRQAVPLVKPQAPLVGTGMEASVAKDSGAVVVAQRPGVVDQVDASRIVIRVQEKGQKNPDVDIYALAKFQKSNAGTCINQKPIVSSGDYVEKGTVLADGFATDLGELALGRNLVVAFLSWNGYCFEDSIVISEKLVQEDAFTSIHIDEFEVSARDTKLGHEEITRDIPGVGEEALRHLDESGVAYIGAEVKPGDILVGKVTPKGENPMTSEEKLLRAIFGEKASDVKDTSLRLPSGTSGHVVDVRVFLRKGVEKDDRALAIEQADIRRLSQDNESERSILNRHFYESLKKMLHNKTLEKSLKNLPKGTLLQENHFQEMPLSSFYQAVISGREAMDDIESLKKQHEKSIADLQERFDKNIEKIKRGDELPAGVMKTVRIFVAVKRCLQPGDKMAGRHGNKGVVSRIVPVEDMPYLEDGTPVDIVLNPLSLPSRMNVGQILETHLGWAARGWGKKIEAYLETMADQNVSHTKDLRDFLKEIYQNPHLCDKIDSMSDEGVVKLAVSLTKGFPMASPVFDGVKEKKIASLLQQVGLDPSGKSRLYDGRTGESFHDDVTVGVLYMLKLHHLVDQKIHARSVGPYSLVTQQPLGGKAQLGGQRLGEMEVWALEAYGAAYTLQEMLTVKSDDVSGRTKVYESIVRGDNDFECGVPESFNVLVKELKSLCLNLECTHTP